MPSSRPHGCRSMHTSQIVFGVDPASHNNKSSTYSNTFYDKYSEPVSNDNSLDVGKYDTTYNSLTQWYISDKIGFDLLPLEISMFIDHHVKNRLLDCPIEAKFISPSETFALV